MYKLTVLEKLWAILIAILSIYLLLGNAYIFLSYEEFNMEVMAKSFALSAKVIMVGWPINWIMWGLCMSKLNKYGE